MTCVEVHLPVYIRQHEPDAPPPPCGRQKWMVPYPGKTM